MIDPGFPVFDADNHLYETADAFTGHLPAAQRNVFRFVEVNGRKKLGVRASSPSSSPTRRSTSWPVPAHT